jgi:hypothetical protein
MEFFELISQLLMAASIFQKMGTGSQSGKLFFKKLYSGDNIIMSEGPNTITVSNTFTQTPIVQNRVVIGTGDNITSSYDAGFYSLSFCKNSYQSFLFNLSHMANYNTSLSPIFYEPYTKQPQTVGKSNTQKGTYNTLLISGMNNSACPSSGIKDSIIIGGRFNSFKQTFNQKFSSMIGGLGNSFTNNEDLFQCNDASPTEDTIYYSSIIGGQRNCISRSSNSVIIGGDRNKLLGPTATGRNLNSTIIGGCCNFISFVQSIECVRDSIIVSGNKNCLRQGVNNSAIVGSECSTIGISQNYPSIPTPESYSVRNSLILSGRCNTINTCAVEATGIYNSYLTSNSNNSIITGYKNIIQSSSYNTIVSGEQNVIQLFGESDNLYLKQNTILSSPFSCIIHAGEIDGPGAMSSKFNTIISSRDSKLVSLIPKFGQFLITSIIGGNSNCTICTRLCSSFFKYSSFIGGCKNFIQTADDIDFVANLSKWTNATVIGGSGLSASGVSIGGRLNRTRTITSTILGGILNNSAGKIISSKRSCGPTSSIIVSGYKFYSGKNSGFDDCIVSVGGCCGESDANKNSVFISTYRGRLQGTQNTILIGGSKNCVVSPTPVAPSNNNFIIGGGNNFFRSNCALNNFNAQDILNSGILGGQFNVLYKNGVNPLQNTVILGATGMSTSSSNTMVVKNMWITATLSTGSPGHFTQSFTYSLDGITGNFLNPSNIRFVNGIVVAIDGQKVDYNEKLQFSVSPGAPGGASPSFTFSVSQVTSPEILVQWGINSSATYSGTSITAGYSYSSTTNRTITVFGTFSGFTYSLQETFGYGSIQDISRYGSVNRITVTGSFFFGGSSNFNTSAFTSVNNWQYINFSRNNFTVANVNSILTYLDSLPVGTVTDVLLFSQSTPAIPTGAGSASRAQLLSEGVNVITDWF